ncbi:thiamine-phosphate kinase [Solimicrobium silvestre]|uniref:Thiamine-monophosphate kinase n=1 Tax=Solimicrobium silvestre TaxID=2099400 RepID=A0A2S9H072_9BURK|nr:thiamine-phosphate kinase [Solimicrobium silvestre]PRC93367.1 thiL: thiamine-monophosphate kinase [Solimicrobium silvestre]
MSEFELIQHYFTERQSSPSYIPLGIGDDCALMSARVGMQLAISSDMLVAGRHFFADANPRMLGHKSLAVNLSDLAAMGAEPRAFTLALALPEVQPDWLRDFSEGMFFLAEQHHCQLIGGDTTKGPLNICITVFGEVPIGQALRRDAAQAGDDIWVSGALGDARLALAGYLKQQALSEADHQQAALRLHQPSPRITLGLALRGIAHAAIDVSDGLIGDLGHILKRSQLGATLWCDSLPFGPILAQQNTALCREYALAGGDDYELCFTAPSAQRSAVLAAAKQADTVVTRIGYIEAEAGLRIVDANNQPLSLSHQSFDHFSS